MVERLGEGRGAKKCPIPLAIVLTKPGKRCQATSCLPRGGEPGSSSRQLDFKPQALIQSHFCFSSSIFFFCLSLPHPPALAPCSEHPLELLNISTLFSSVSTGFPDSDQVSPTGLQRCRPNKVTELTSIS